VSYKLSRRVFSLDISSTEKLVLRALADRANDDGSSCYPSVLTLAKETSLSRKTVQTTLRSLQARGLVVIGGQSKGGRGKTPDYHLRFPKVDQKSNQKTHRKGVTTSRKGRTCVP
jgi:pyocin large subunit-like protein